MLIVLFPVSLHTRYLDDFCLVSSPLLAFLTDQEKERIEEADGISKREIPKNCFLPGGSADYDGFGMRRQQRV